MILSSKIRLKVKSRLVTFCTSSSTQVIIMVKVSVKLTGLAVWTWGIEDDCCGICRMPTTHAVPASSTRETIVHPCGEQACLSFTVRALARVKSEPAARVSCAVHRETRGDVEEEERGIPTSQIKTKSSRPNAKICIYCPLIVVKYH